MDQKLHKKLNERREKGTLRSLSSFDGRIDFVSNDYLGLAKVDFKLVPDFGSTGSRLISGNHARIESVESELASFFESPAALCFNSGYDANLGIFGSIPQKGDVVLYDEAIHASVRDGLRLSHAQAFSFKHNDIGDLERLLTRFNGTTTYVAIEGLYSMEGDIAPIGKIIQLLKNYNAFLIVDEAHSAGVFGERGKGLIHALNATGDCFIRLITFGKAYGGHGAVALCSEDVRNYLINFARSFIYTTALPFASYEKLLLSVQLDDLNDRRLALQQNIRRFRAKMKEEYLVSEINSPIQVIRGLEASRLQQLQERAKLEGLGMKLLYPPTVKIGDECIRICIHSFNSSAEFDKLIALLTVFELTSEN